MFFFRVFNFKFLFYFLFLLLFLGWVDYGVDVWWDEVHPLLQSFNEDCVVEAFGAAVIDVAACAVKYPPCLGYEYGGIWFGGGGLKCPGIPGEVVLLCYVSYRPSEDGELWAVILVV